MRSLLFVPADSGSKIAKAMTTDADALILDLEDAVAPACKATGRQVAAQVLSQHERADIGVKADPETGQ